MPTIAEKRRTFRALHREGCFVIPNPWDVGSARYLQHLGFKALATTSSGAAWSMGFADGDVPLNRMLDHLRTIAKASDLPINADFLDGYADAPDKVAANVQLAVATGVAGLSIEDQIPGTRQLYDAGLAVERIAAARSAIDATGGDTLLVARSECYLTGHAQPLKEAISRLEKFSQAGADCLFAPGVRTREDILALVKAVAPKPLNVIVGWPSELTVGDLAALGVRRISVGGALARSAWGGFLKVAKDIADNGTFGAFADAAPSGELNAFFKADSGARSS